MPSLRLFQGFLPIHKKNISLEIMAGITLAALAIPEVMGYTKISGTPVITGLYTMLIPMVLFAFFCSSRHLVVGADSATAAILAGTLTGMASRGSPEYVALAGALALISGGLLILARLTRIGFMADFLSRTMLIGFLTGVGIQVAIGEISRQWHQKNIYDLAIALAVIALIAIVKKFSKKIPGALIAVIGAVVISDAFNLKAWGIQTLGEIPQGLPHIGLPDVPWSWALLQRLLPTAFSMFIVILAQSAATSRAYAARYDQAFDENLDLFGLGAANIGAALSGTFVVNGSPTKTQMVDAAGGRSQLSQLVASVVILTVLLFFTRLLSSMPEAVLSAVVFLIGIELIDLKGMKQIWQQRPSEFWVAFITAVVVVFVGVEQGILIAMVLSLVEHVRRSYRSQNSVLVRDKSAGSWQVLPVTNPKELAPGILLYRFAHTMYYANAQQLFDQVTFLISKATPPLSVLCIDASAVADVDFSAAQTLRELQGILKSRGVRIVWVHAIDSLKAEFDRYGLTQLFGKEAFYNHVNEVLDHEKDSVQN